MPNEGGGGEGVWLDDLSSGHRPEYQPTHPPALSFTPS